MSKDKVRSGAAYLYIETASSMVSSYVFWLVMSKITSSSVIGTSSAMISFASIVTALATMGVPTSVQRFLGKSMIEKSEEYTSTYIKAAFIVVVFSTLICSTSIYMSKDWIYTVFKINFDLIIVSILLIASSVIRYLFRYIIIASLSTEVLVLTSILPTILRFAVAIILIFLGTGAYGLTIGYTMFPLIGTMTLIPSILKYLRPSSSYKIEISLLKAIKNILIAGMANWIPNVLGTLGSQLGTIVVLGSQGASQAGVYFIALSIFTAISTGMSVIFSITYPVTSGMKDGRKRFTNRVINLSLYISLPISSALVFYSKEIMSLFGPQYIHGAASLEILMLSMLPTAVMSGISTLCYSYRNYKQVLIIGLATSIPRMFFYFVLVPLYPESGAALSNTAGAVLGFAASVLIAKQIQMPIAWRDITLIFGIPTAVGFLIGLSGLWYIIGILLILICSYILYLKTRIIQRLDVEDLLGILPPGISRPLIKFVHGFGKIIDKSY